MEQSFLPFCDDFVVSDDGPEPEDGVVFVPEPDDGVESIIQSKEQLNKYQAVC